MQKRTTLLTILDGWGLGGNCPVNAIQTANTPTFDMLLENYPNTKLFAHGRYVGLPDGQMGNSEVGHLNIGAGRIVYQDLTRINLAIEDKSFFKNPEFIKAAEHAKKNNSSLHFIGLVSDGGVHSSLEHLFASIDFAKQQGLEKVYAHAFLDGRDTPPRSACKYLAELEEKLKKENMPQIASVMGRYYAMDRDKRWDRVEKAYNCLLLGEGKAASNSAEAINNSYDLDNLGDEFVLPSVTADDANSRIKDNDSVIFINYRPDRAREITNAINSSEFNGFNRKKVLNNVYFLCMTEYDETFNLPVAYRSDNMTNILGDILDRNNIREFRTAETEKYAHVTFFFNGGVEKAYATETRCLVPSPKVATYDLQPEMSAPEVADKVIEALKSGEYEFVLVNFANPDMVGHTGILEAAVKAIETVDNCIKRIFETVKEVNAVMLLTADHGNAECMEDPETHKPFTAHTLNQVPFIVINSGEEIQLRDNGCLADIAPTALDLFGIEKPQEMTGNSLIL
ncbi:MAG TPA: 2,3-bisphosphoglycerate-independent phosphoglycerate mutase [Candidatus Gastranaerophilales bacterium]|nr:2,3-bisphosphoglycerate-independent phosphoglycerate mutase [Candidatus Gastranaerophilales bacterium]